MNDKNKQRIGSNAKNLVKLFAFNSVQIEESFDRRTLDTISEGILEMGKGLEQLTREKIECLRTVIKCKEYIFWLREELKGKCFFLENKLTNDRQSEQISFFGYYTALVRMRGDSLPEREISPVN